MTLRGMIFDIDGTLVDTNPAHVEAWRRAFQRLGYDVPTERIEVEIGKGGDLLVPSILGEEVEKRHGEFQALRQRGIRTALATSSDKKHLQATGVWRDTGHLYADLDHALEIASVAAAASH